MVVFVVGKGLEMKSKLAAGNWKMNGLGAELSEIETLIANMGTMSCDVLICPPATLIARMSVLSDGTSLHVGAQDCHADESGAHTGDLSAEMLVDAGASHVILGHSERRADHGETDAVVQAKTVAAWRAGLNAIVCVGETEAQRDAGETLNVVAAQMAGSLPDGCLAQQTVVAYEPIWAIGTGRTPTLEQIAEVHAFMRAELVKRFPNEASQIRLLYGGSVKPSNAVDIFAQPDVDGALVGGASLKALDFSQIVLALNSAE